MHHRAGLAHHTRRTHEPGFAETVETDWRSAPLDDRQRALLVYAEKLTVSPGAMVEADLAPLRAASLTDRAILEANLVVAYFAYVNRLADGLGVRVESGDAEGDR